MTGLTAEQRAAIEDRSGSSLLSAAAGSGKTAVMAERFAEAVARDGVPVGGILAITFTEKAAGELRERIRARLLARGLDEEARALDGAFVGTIHGFCARVLRARPLAAGLDPRFTVLEEPAAQRLAERAFDEALEAWAGARGDAALDVVAAYGESLRPLVLDCYAALRSRGEERPRVPLGPPPPPPDPGTLAGARQAAAALLGAARPGKAVDAALAALDACEATLSAEEGAGGVVALAPPPWPAALAAGELKRNAAVLKEPACEAYRDAWAGYRQACADHHAWPVLALLDALLAEFGDAYARAKAGRASVDFADLELRALALLTGQPALRREWAERFALVMVDEFQDTNRVQLALLEALERDNLFAVGDEQQAIYGFRHADVEIFRERRAALAPPRRRRLRANFRSTEELLDALNATFAGVFGDALAPLVAGAPVPPPDGELRLFDPDRPAAGAPPVELLVTDCRGWEGHEAALGLAALAPQVWRRAEARAVAHRLAAEHAAGRRAGDMVVLVRATASLRLFEQALEEQGLPTYVVGGRGYWSQEQVRDGLAYLAALAAPLDEEALYTVLASPFCGVSADALVLIAEAGRSSGAGAWAALRADHPLLGALPDDERERLAAFARRLAAERADMERRSIEALLQRGVQELGYDLAVLARADGNRRLANLRKLMRLAREYERAEGRDLRGFLAYARAQDLREAREGDAALEADGLDAVRLMTIHRVKGLEFPLVCVADLGRTGTSAWPALLVGRDGRVGLRLAPMGGGERVSALAYEELAAGEATRADAEERRLLYVALTRAREALILSGGVNCDKPALPRPGGAPLAWLLPAVLGDAAPPPDATVITRAWHGRAARVLARRITPATLPAGALARVRRAAAAPGTQLPAEPKVMPAVERAHPRRLRLSYSALRDYAKCPYRFYLTRELRLPRDPLSEEERAAWLAAELRAEDAVAALAQEGRPAPLDKLTRGSLAHALLERLDVARPAVPDAIAVRALAERFEVELGEEDVEDLRALVAAFVDSPLQRRLATARRLRAEAPFAFALEPGGSGALMSGIVDVHASEQDGGVLIVDYKTDQLEGASPRDIVERDYGVQRAVYALAALRAGAPRVEVAYCFLEAPLEPVTATFTESSALEESLLTLAQGALDRRYPVTPHPHLEICGACPGRRSLCSYAGRFPGQPA